jgi:DNA invertase Pin-like site-specific DNA recombinase
MFQMMGVFAEFERAMIRERVLAGLARAKQDGIHLGRKFTEGTRDGNRKIKAALAMRPRASASARLPVRLASVLGPSCG